MNGADQWPITCHGVAYPWLCDQMGHLNTVHYMSLFSIAAHHFLHNVGAPAITAGHGWADVRQEVDYHKEVPGGALIVVRSALVAIGRSSIRTRHVMTDPQGAIAHATMEMVSVYFDLDKRCATPLPPEARRSLSEHVASA